MDSASIYRTVFGEGARPDAWQHRFTADEWPEILIAPTGSGKTAAVTLGWAAHRMRAPETTPRRLVWCLPMRTLVDQTARAANEWFYKLKQAGVDENYTLPLPDEDVHVLMGGVESARWLDHPERPAVIVGTQDMLLSRALMRGYASSRAIWPMEFALLHEDTQWVFDEVQLMGAGRATSAQLEAFRRCEAARAARNGGPRSRPARSLWISATLDPQWLRTVDYSPPARSPGENEPLTVEGGRLWEVDPRPEDDRLWRLATAKKTLSRANAVPSTAKADDIGAYIDELADSVLDAHRAGRMTLVIVNRVARAQALHAALGKRLGEKGEGASELALVHARFRPADRRREMNRIPVNGKENGEGSKDLIVVSTQAVEAGVDVSAAVLFTELAPWPSMVQRFGRANRYAEVTNGADVRWIDLLDGQDDDKDAADLALPYTPEEMETARRHLLRLSDVAPAALPAPGDVEPPRRVIRRKDLDDLFDTDPDLTGFDVDVSPYVRDAADTDVHVFWRDLSSIGDDPPRPRAEEESVTVMSRPAAEPPRPRAEELCAVPIGAARDWLKKVGKREKGNAPVFVRDPQWRRGDHRAGAAPPGWRRLTENPWPGLTLLVDVVAGGYREAAGFTGDPADVPTPVVPDARGHVTAGTRELTGGPADTPIPMTPPEESQATTTGAPQELQPDAGGEAEGYDEDPRSGIGVPVSLSAHLGHVAKEADTLCRALAVDSGIRAAIVRAARWHDLGKAHEVFQNTMRRGLDSCDVPDGLLLAKTTNKNLRHERHYFRHELASALAFLAHEKWSREADLVAYLVAAHHGKVRMNLRALPRERAPSDDDRSGARFARGVWEDDELPPVDLGDGERWEGGGLTLSVMELGWDEATRESWTERTRDLLAHFGPFRLAWMETLVRVADWRASRKEQKRRYDDA